MSLLLAARFLTVLPAGRGPAPTSQALARSMAWFPLVGLGLGAALAGLDLALRLAFPPGLADVLLLAALILLTGGLHLDGLMDTCDGAFAPADRQRRLEIMRDSRVGSFGVLGAALVLLAKYAALGALPGSARPAALMATLCLSRFAVVLATRAFPYARPQGLGTAFKAHLGWPRVALAAAIAIMSTGLLLQWRAIPALALTGVVALGTGAFLSHRLGGLTGDSYGAINELVETAVWLLLASLTWRGL